MTDDRIPVSILTGFLGSGKTTLLNRLLRDPGMGETAVIVNEFGAIGIDNALIVGSSDQVLLLESGCICCAVRGDLLHTLGELMTQRKTGAVSPFKRVVIETTGLADPAPILQSLMSDLMMLGHFRAAPMVTVVDGYHGVRALDEHAEAVKQVALADRLVITKSDIAAPETLEKLRARLATLNPAAPVSDACLDSIEPAMLFGAADFSVSGKMAELKTWLAAHAGSHSHDHSIVAHCLTFDAPLDWDDAAQWLDGLALDHGEHLLRIKGLLNIRGQAEPVVIQGVHHLFHPAANLPAWPDGDHRSRLVFIVRNLDRSVLLAGAPCAHAPTTG